MIPMHQLPLGHFWPLAAGDGGPSTISYLCAAERSKHILLLRSVLEAAARTRPDIHGDLDLASAWRVLAQAQARDPDAVADLLLLPELGAWAIDCLLGIAAADRDERATRLDFAQFGAIAIAAGLRTGLTFELPVALRGGRLFLPGFGSFQTALRADYVRLRYSASELTLLTERSAHVLPWPWPRPERLTVEHAGLELDVQFDPTNPYLDRYGHDTVTWMDQATLGRWRDRFAGAWRILVEHHRSDAEAIAEGVRAVVPLNSASTTVVSATSTAAFGAVATSLPPDDLMLAETLVHEFQHLKLCALLDLVPLSEGSNGGLYYVPWRDDPRPLNGLIQGTYAFLGIARFWRTQRFYLPPGKALRGHVEFARRRSEALDVAQTLLGTGLLTEVGTRMVSRMRDRLMLWHEDEVPDDAQRLAEEVSTDHKLTWQIRHFEFDSEAVRRLVCSWRVGARPEALVLAHSGPRVRSGVRYGPHYRGILLSMRYVDPRRFRAWLTDGRRGASDGWPADLAEQQEVLTSLSAGDLALLSGDTAAAVRAFRSEIQNGVARPDVWSGLAMAVRPRQTETAIHTFLSHAPLLSTLHAKIRTLTGESPDPFELAAWLATSSFAS